MVTGHCVIADRGPLADPRWLLQLEPEGKDVGREGGMWDQMSSHSQGQSPKDGNATAEGRDCWVLWATKEQGARDEQEPTRQRQEVRSYGTPLAYAMVRVGWENPIHGLAWKLPEAASQVKCLPQGSLGWMSDYLE